MPSDITISITFPSFALLFIALLMRIGFMDMLRTTPSYEEDVSPQWFFGQVIFLWWVLHLFYWLVRWP